MVKNKNCWVKTADTKDNVIFRSSRDKAIFIESPSSVFTHTDKWVVKTYKKFLQIEDVRDFDSKAKALKFTKSYMNKNKGC